MQSDHPRYRLSPLKKLISGVMSALMLVTPFSGYANPADLLPQGGVITSGAANINVNGAQMTIDQISNRAISQWDSFNIGENAGVNVNQPTTSSAFLARIVGQDPSQILGRLDANGHVYLTNPNGIVFGQNARVNVGALVASTLNISDQDFMAGVNKFVGDSNAAIVNRGSIKAGEFVALFSKALENAGEISAASAALAAASGQISFEVDQAYGGSISIDIDGARGNLINTGVIDVQTANGNGGSAVLRGGNIIQAGTISANAATEDNDGGYINFETTGGAAFVSGSQTQATGGGTVIVNNPGDHGFTGEFANSRAVTYTDAIITTLGGEDDGFVELSGASIQHNGMIESGNVLFDPFNIIFRHTGLNHFPNPANVAAALADMTYSASEDSNTVTIMDLSSPLGIGGVNPTVTFEAVNDIRIQDGFVDVTVNPLAVNSLDEWIGGGAASGATMILRAGRDITIDPSFVHANPLNNSEPFRIGGAGAGTLTLIAGNDISIPTIGGGQGTIQSAVFGTADNFNATANRDITIGEIGVLMPGAGTINLNSGRDLTIGPGGTIVTNGTTNARSVGNMILDGGAIITGSASGTANLSAGGSITSPVLAAAVNANTLVIDGVDNIGTGSSLQDSLAIDLNQSTGTVTVRNASGDVNLFAQNDIILDSIVAEGDIFITADAGGEVDLQVGFVESTFGDVTLSAQGGFIRDDASVGQGTLGNDTSVDVRGNIVTLLTELGVGQTGRNGAIDIDATMISVNNLESGLTVPTSAGGVFLNIVSPDLAIVQQVRTFVNDENVEIYSSNDLRIDENGVFNFGNNGEILVESSQGLEIRTVGLLTNNSNINTISSNDLMLNAGAILAGTGTVTIDAGDGGDIRSFGSLGANIAAGNLVISRAGSVGLAPGLQDAIKLDIADGGTIEITSAIGDVNIYGQNDLRITEIVSGGNVDIQTDDSDPLDKLDILIGGGIRAVSASGQTNGDISLNASGFIREIAADQTADLVGNNVTLQAIDGVGRVTPVSANGAIDIVASGVVSASSRDTVGVHLHGLADNPQTGAVVETLDLTLGSLDSGADPTVITGVRSIVDDGNNATVVAAPTLTLQAATNIGANGNAIDTDAGNIINSTAGGNVFIADVADVTVLGSATAPGIQSTVADSTISIAAGNDLTLTGDAANAAVLTADRSTVILGAGQDILNGTAQTQVQATNLIIDTARNVGSAADATNGLNVNLTGTFTSEEVFGNLNVFTSGALLDVASALADGNVALAGGAGSVINLQEVVTVGGTVTASGADRTELDGEIAALGDITFSNAAVVDTNSVVTSTTGDVIFVSTLNSDVADTNSLEINALAGKADFRSTVGDAFTLNSLLINAGDTDFDADVTVGTAGLEVNGADNGTVTLGGNIVSGGTVLINDSVALADEGAGDANTTRSITTTAAGANVTITGTVNSIVTTAADAEALSIVTTGATNVTLGDSVGDTGNLASLTIDAEGETELNGEIRTTGAVNLTAAEDIQLGTDLAVVAGGDVTFGTDNGDSVDGGFDLNVDSAGTVTVNSVIGGNEVLSEVNLDGATLVDLEADVNALDATFTSATLIDVDAAQTNDAGTTTFNGATVASADVTAGEDLTFNGTLTGDTAARTFASTNGSIDVNGTVLGAVATNFDALNGNVELDLVNTTGALDVDATTLTLTENVTADSVDTTGVGLTTLADDDFSVDIATNGAVNLGPVEGNNALTIAAATAAGQVDLGDVNVDTLTITDANDVDLNGQITTNDTVSITGVDVDVDVDGNVNAGGTVTVGATGDVLISAEIVSAANTTATPAIGITAGSDVTFDGTNGLVEAADGHVALTATAGNLQETVADLGDGTDYDVVARTVALSAAAGSIGDVGANAVEISASEAITATTGGGNINLADLEGEFLVGNVNAGAGNVTITADSINDAAVNNDLVTDITGNVVTLTAEREIGGRAHVDTEAVSLDVSSTVAGNIDINEQSGVTLTDVDAQDGSITIDTTLTVAGLTTITDVAILTDNDANDVTIVSNSAAGSEVVIGAITTGGTASDVTVTANGGSIGDATTGADAVVDVTADVVSFNATDDIGRIGNIGAIPFTPGATRTIETESNTVDAVLVDTAGAAGVISINDLSGTNFRNVVATNGAIFLQAGGDSTATNIVTQGATGAGAGLIFIQMDAGDLEVGTITADDSNGFGNVSITANAAAGQDLVDLDNNSLITGSDLTINVTGNIGTSTDLAINTTVDDYTDIDSITAGSIFLNETNALTITDVDAADGSVWIQAGGAITQTAGQDLSAGGAGDVTLITTAGGITIDSVTALGDQVTITSATSIEHTDADASDVVADTADLNAGTGIGTTGALDLVGVDTLTADTTTGAIDLNNAADADVTVTTMTTGDGNITYDQTLGTFDLLLGTVSADTVNDTITINTTGAIDNVADNAGAEVTGANLILNTTAEGIGQGANGAVDVDVTVQLDSNSNGTNISIDDVAGDLPLGLVTANAGGGTVTLTSVGAIVDAGAGDAADDILAGTLNLTAVAGIGINNVLEIDADTLTAANNPTVGTNSTADIAITDSDALIVAGAAQGDVGVDNTNSGDVTLITNGLMTITGDVIARDGGNVALTAQGGGSNVSIQDDVISLVDLKDQGLGVVTPGTITIIADTDVTFDSADALVSNTQNILNATNGTVESVLSSTVTITATNGNIDETVADAGANVDVAGATVTLNALNGSIGATDAVEVDTLTALNADTSTGGGNVTINEATGDLLIGAVDAGAGNVTLAALAGSINDATANPDTVTDVTGNLVTLTATGEVGGTAHVDTEAVSLDVSAGAGAIVINEATGVDLVDVDTVDGAITINTNGATVITDVASLNDTDANDITITAVTGNVTIGAATAGGTAGDVTITATAGAIDDLAPNADTTTDVTGDVVTLTAANGIGATADVDTAANSLDASVTAAGAIIVNEADAVTLSDVDTFDGPITITTLAAGDVEVDAVDAGDNDANSDNDVVLTVFTGNVTDADDNSLITGDQLTIQATGAIGAANGLAINTTVNTYEDIDSTTAGDVWLNETDALTINDVDALSGSVWIQAGGAITQTAGQDLSAGGAGDVTLITTAGGITIDSVTALGDQVTFTSATTIEHTDADASDIVADTADLNAGTGIGTTGALDLVGVDTLTADTTIGAIDLNNAADADVTVTTMTTGDGNITYDQTFGTFDLLLGTVSADTVNDTITINTTGAIDNVADNAGAEVTGANLILNTTAEGIGQGANGAVDVDATVQLDSNSNGTNISIDDVAGDLPIGLVTANADGGAVTLTSVGGIVDVDAAGGDDVLGGAVSLTAVTGIGSANAIEIDATTLLAANNATVGVTAANHIDIIDTDELEVIGAAQGDVGTNNTNEGNVQIVTGGTMTVTGDVIARDGGTITLTTTAGDVVIEDQITSSVGLKDQAVQTVSGLGEVLPGTITVTAAANVGFNSADAVITVTQDILDATNGTTSAVISGTANVVANGGNIQETFDDETGPLNQNTLDVTAATINLTATGSIGTVAPGFDIELDSLTSVNATAGGDVNLTELNGPLVIGQIDAGGELSGNDVTLTGASIEALNPNDGTFEISAEDVTLTATAGGIGTNGAVELDALTITATAANADIVLTEVEFPVPVGGDNYDMQVVSVDAGTGNVTLTSNAGAIFDAAAGDATVVDVTGTTVDLNAATGIGLGEDLEVAATNWSADSTTGNVDVNSILATAVNATSVTTGTGTINVEQSGGGAVTFGTVTTADGAITLDQQGDADLTIATSVTAGGANDVLITTTGASGNVILTGTTTADGDTVTITSIDAINGAGLVTADTVDLNAENGIGNTTGVELAATNITADSSVDGDVTIDNTLATDVVVTTLTTADGDVSFDQAGGGNVSFTTVAGGGADGDVALSNTGGDLTNAGSVTAAGTGDVTLTTITSGDVELTGTTTADEQTVTITSAGDVNGAGLITADILDIDAFDGIGDDTALEATEVTTLSADTTTGIIDIDNLADADVTVTTMTTGDGNVTYNQEGAFTAFLGNVAADTVDDVVTITSQGAIEEAGADADADVTGASLNLTATGGGIGAVAPIEIDATVVLNADSSTTGGNIQLSDVAGDLPLGNVDAGTGDATLTSVGAVTDTNGATVNVNADDLVIDAVTGVTVDTTVTTIDVDNSTSGDIDVTELAAGTTLEVLNASQGDVGVEGTNAGNVSIVTEAGTLTVSGPVASRDGGTVTLDANGAGSDVVISGTISSTVGLKDQGVGEVHAGDVTVTADDDVLFDNDGLISITETILDATNGTTTIVQAGNANVTAASDVLELADNGAGVAEIVAETINITATAGAIGEAADTNIDGEVLVGALEIDSGIATLNATAAADINIVEVDGDLALGLVDSTTDGAVTLATLAGNIVEATDDATVNVDGGAVTLTAVGGGIGTTSSLDIDSATLTADSSANNGNIDVTEAAAGGDLTLVSVNAGTGDATLTAAGGGIEADGAAANPLIVADDLTLTAVNGIGDDGVINTNVTTVTAANSTDGNIAIGEVAAGTDLVVGGAMQAGTGDITITTAAGALSTTGAVSVADAAANVTLTATGGDLTVGSTVDALNGQVALSTTVDGTSVIIGATGDVETIGGEIDVTSAEDLEMIAGGTITTATGLIDINTDDAVIMRETALPHPGVTSAIASTTGQIDIDAVGDVTVTSISTGNAGDDAIAITTTAGAIIDGGDVAVDLVANTAGAIIDLDAANGIGAGNAIETTAAIVEIDNTGTGSVEINETDTLSINNVTSADGDVVITAGGTTTIEAASGGVVASGAGNAITIDVTTGDLLANDVISAVNGAGAITASAAGAITQAPTAIANAGSGAITATAGTDITLGQLTTTGTVDVTLNAGGAVIGNDTLLDVNAPAATLVVNAVNGVGSGEDIDTTVAALDIDNTTSGNVIIDETDDVNVERIVQGSPEQGANGGNIAVTADGTITVVDNGDTSEPVIVAVDGGDVTLTADGAGSDVVVNDGIITDQGGAVTLMGADDVLFSTADGDVTAGGAGTVTITATAGVVTQADGSLVDAGTGLIDVNANGDVTLGGLATSNDAANAVTIDSTTGAVIDGGDADVDVAAPNGGLVINAVTGVGDAGALETTVDSLDVDNTTSGNVEINETDALTIANVTQGEDDSILITAGNAITVAGAVTITDTADANGNGDIVLTAVDGVVDVDAAVTNNSNGVDADVTLSAGGEAGDADIDAAVTAAGGDVSITAGNDAFIDAAISAAVDVSITAEDSVTGTGTIDADSDTNDTGNATLTADNDDDNDGELELSGTITGDNVTITGDEVTLGAVTADIAGTGSGNVDIDSATDVTLNGAVAAGATDGTIDVDAATGDIDAASTLTAGGNITTTAAINTDLDGNVTSANGTVDVNSGQNVTIEGNVDGNAVEIDGTTGDVTTNGTILADTTTVTITAGDDLAVNNTVTAETTVGLTTENGDATINGAVDAVLDNVVVTVGGDLETTAAGTLTAEDDVTTTAGGETELGALVDAATGSISITTGTDLTTTAAATLTAEDNVTTTAGVNTTLGGNVTADTGTVDVNSGQNVTIDGNVDGNAVEIDGETGDVTTNGTILADTTTVTITAGDDLVVNNTVTAETTVGLTTENGDATINGAVDAVLDNVVVTVGGDLETTAAGTLTAEDDVTTTAGGETELGALVDAATGSISITTGTDLTTTAAATLTAEDNVTTTAGVNTTLGGNVTADTGTVDVNSGQNVTIDGNVDGNAVEIDGETGDVTTNGTILADTTTVTITAGDDLAVNNTVTAETTVGLTTENGDATINGAVDAVLDNVVVTVGGDLETTAAGTLTAEDDVTTTAGGETELDALVDAATGSVSITTGTDLTTTAAATLTAALDVTTVAGDDTTLGGNVTATVGTVSVTSGENVTVDGDVDGNDVVITSATGNVTTNGTIVADTTDVTITAALDVTVNDTISADDNATISAGEDITLNSSVTAVTGDATITAVNHVVVNSTFVEAADDIFVTADADGNGAGTVLMSADSDFLAPNSTVSGASVVIGQIADNDADATADTVTVTATAGTITAADAAQTDITADAVDLDATDGIGTGANGAIDVANAETIAADTTGESADVMIDSDQTIDGNNVAFTGSTLGEDSDIALGAVGGGDLDLVSATTENGDVTVTADGDVAATFVRARDIAGDENGAPAAADDRGLNGLINDTHSVIITTSGAGSDVFLGDVRADANVTVTTADGTITAGVGSTFAANDVNLTQGGIGPMLIDNDALTALNDVNVTHTGTGDVYLDDNAITAGNNANVTVNGGNLEDATFDTAVIAASPAEIGDVDTDGDGALSDAEILAADGLFDWNNDTIIDATDLTPFANAGGGVTTITSGNDINLGVTGYIGEAIDPLEVVAGDQLNLTYLGMGLRPNFWATLTGTAGGSIAPENVNYTGNTTFPPGFIFWNGMILGGQQVPFRQYLRAESFYNEVRHLISGQPVLIMDPIFFMHVVVDNNHRWAVPAIEHINMQPRAMIEDGSKKGKHSEIIDVKETQDESWSTDHWFHHEKSQDEDVDKDAAVDEEDLHKQQTRAN